jgi:hypothetical protein
MTVPFAFGGDPNAFFLSDAQVAFKYAIISQPLWAWSMCTIKSSFALMLLRIEQKLCWRRFLWIMIILQIVVAVYNTIGILLQCVPIYKAWDLLGTVPGSCWSKDSQSTSTIVVAVFSIITDFIFAALPISFLRKIQRPLRERMIVGVLMGLGVFAGISSIVKITAAVQFGRTNDMISESIKIGMWSVIEELVGFIVICVPCLRSPLQRAIQTFGGMTSRMRQYGKSRGYGRTYDPNEEVNETSRSKSRLSVIMDRSRSSDMGFKLGSLRTERSSKDVQWENSAVKKPCEIWCTKEVVVDHDRLSRMPSDEWPNAGPNAVWTDHDFSLGDMQMGRAI